MEKMFIVSPSSQLPRPTLENIVALRGPSYVSAAWLNRWAPGQKLVDSLKSNLQCRIHA